jgi:hypothetical protein
MLQAFSGQLHMHAEFPPEATYRSMAGGDLMADG